MTRVYAVVSKGGDGKSTTSGAYADAMARAGLRTLVVDLDGQATVSTWLLPARAAVDTETSVEAVLAASTSRTTEAALAASVRHVASGEPGAGCLDLLPATAALHRFNVGDQTRRLAALRKAASHYDAVVLDTGAYTPDGEGAGLQAAAMAVADVAVIVGQPSPPTIWNVPALLRRAQGLEVLRKHRLPVVIQPTAVPPDRNGRQFVAILATYADTLHPARRTNSVPNAMLEHQTLEDYAMTIKREDSPARKLAADYRTATAQLLEVS